MGKQVSLLPLLMVITSVMSSVYYDTVGYLYSYDNKGYITKERSSSLLRFGHQSSDSFVIPFRLKKYGDLDSSEEHRQHITIAAVNEADAEKDTTYMGPSTEANVIDIMGIGEKPYSTVEIRRNSNAGRGKEFQVAPSSLLGAFTIEAYGQCLQPERSIKKLVAKDCIRDHEDSSYSRQLFIWVTSEEYRQDRFDPLSKVISVNDLKELWRTKQEEEFRRRRMSLREACAKIWRRPYPLDSLAMHIPKIIEEVGYPDPYPPHYIALDEGRAASRPSTRFRRRRTTFVA